MCAVACALAHAGVAHAADTPWPVRPIRLIAPFTPAGATDLLARLTAEALSKRLGQNVVVENRPGAGANLGAEVVARAAPDGYTLLMAPTTVYAAGTALYPKRSFDLLRDFAPIATVATVPHVLIAAPDVKAATPAEFARLAKASPGAFNLASQGVGTISHLEGEWWQAAAGIDLAHVPYKGSAPAHLDLTAGRVQVMFDSVAAALPQVRAQRLRAWAVTTPKRVAALPQVPTMVEAGYADFVAESWLGVLAPAKTPPAITARLAQELAVLAADAAFVAKLAEHGFDARAIVGADYVALMQRETTLWGDIVRRKQLVLD
jgi:tripartite-type tricarboxylate transporter receptor subunit TctC